MANALTVPHAVAALVLCVAGLAKLRSPAGAARAVGLPPGPVRIFAGAELALGVWALADAAGLASLLMTGLYVGFAGLTIRLARNGKACGCFGAQRSPASPLQSLLSIALAGACALAAAGGTHAAAWISGRPPGFVTLLVVGTAGAVYGVVLAYSELPLLWRSWRPAAGRLMPPPAVASPDGERRPA
ncbi:MAG: MauE/DoxX family redox-associated membrane protein [Solirubrobacteraceae bacterium]